METTTHPGEIHDEPYIKTLGLNLHKLADRLGVARNDYSWMWLKEDGVEMIIKNGDC